jgi:hypothetical protein
MAAFGESSALRPEGPERRVLTGPAPPAQSRQAIAPYPLHPSRAYALSPPSLALPPRELSRK